ncbi:MAG TPA: hypothetical protein VMP01_14400 [Pirellulaceae bacterium]|nr:hypothetical protein [Pirellulaceae bacterium]
MSDEILDKFYDELAASKGGRFARVTISPGTQAMFFVDANGIESIKGGKRPHIAGTVQAVYLGDGKIQIGDETIVITEVQAEVLEGLLSAKGKACNKKELRKLSGVPFAERRLAEMVKANPVLERDGLVKLPKGRGKGGYRTTIVLG